MLGVEWSHRDSPISGSREVVWSGKPVTKTATRFAPTLPAVQVSRPAAYWIPAAWSEVIDRLELHGIETERPATERAVEVEMYRLGETRLAEQPFEGRVRLDLVEEPTLERRREVYAPGSARVSTDQPLGELAAHLLEPRGPDSFLQWGYFSEILSRTEYVEGYVIGPLAERMLAADPELRAAFERKLANDAEFAADPKARLHWFYQRTPYFDPRWRLYPVGRER